MAKSYWFDILRRVLGGAMTRCVAWIRGPSTDDILARLAETDRLSRLESLPTELIHMVAERLSPGEATAMVLCSRTLAWELGERYWGKTMKELAPREIKKLLLPMARDHSDMYYCYSCYQLHFNDTKQHRRRQTAYAEKLNRGEFLYLGANFGIVFGHIQRARLASASQPAHPWGGWAHQIGGRWHRDKCPTCAGPPTLNFSAHGLRFVEGRVILRTESRMYTRCRTPAAMSRLAYFFQLEGCKHSACNRYQGNPGALAERINRCVQHGPNSIACVDCNTIVTCPYCPTEYCLQVIRFPKTSCVGIRLVLWRDLGRGEDPTEPAWQAQISSGCDESPWCEDLFGWQREEYGIGSISTKYLSHHDPEPLHLSMGMDWSIHEDVSTRTQRFALLPGKGSPYSEKNPWPSHD